MSGLEGAPNNSEGVGVGHPQILGAKVSGGVCELFGLLTLGLKG